MKLLFAHADGGGDGMETETEGEESARELANKGNGNCYTYPRERDRVRVMAELLHTLYRHGEASWNPSVNRMTAQALRVLRELDPAAYREAASCFLTLRVPTGGGGGPSNAYRGGGSGGFGSHPFGSNRFAPDSLASSSKPSSSLLTSPSIEPTQGTKAGFFPSPSTSPSAIPPPPAGSWALPPPVPPAPSLSRSLPQAMMTRMPAQTAFPSRPALQCECEALVDGLSVLFTKHMTSSC